MSEALDKWFRDTTEKRRFTAARAPYQAVIGAYQSALLEAVPTNANLRTLQLPEACDVALDWVVGPVSGPIPPVIGPAALTYALSWIAASDDLVSCIFVEWESLGVRRGQPLDVCAGGTFVMRSASWVRVSYLAVDSGDGALVIPLSFALRRAAPGERSRATVTLAPWDVLTAADITSIILMGPQVRRVSVETSRGQGIGTLGWAFQSSALVDIITHGLAMVNNGSGNFSAPPNVRFYDVPLPAQAVFLRTFVSTVAVSGRFLVWGEVE